MLLNMNKCNLQQVKTIEDAPRNFKLGAALFNFVWYMVKLPNPESLTYEYEDENEEKFELLYRSVQKDELRIWVVDPEKAVSAELNKKAEKPSPLSRILTKEFFNLGQEIRLTMYPTFHRYETAFNSAEGYVLKKGITKINGLDSNLNHAANLAMGDSFKGHNQDNNYSVTEHQCDCPKASVHFKEKQIVDLFTGIFENVRLYLNTSETKSTPNGSTPNRPKETTGVLTVEFQINHMEYTCKLTSRRVSHISVGCPLKKHLRVKRPSLTGCETKNLSHYIVPGSVLRNPQQNDVLVLYDRKRFGCPIRVYYKTPFKPVLELYMGEKFLSNVSANYILWEEEERTDFYYNTTMLQAGCQREAQTWEYMLAMHKTQQKTTNHVWGPWNYRSCFESHGSVKNMDRPYEILNSTGSMYLTWPTDHTGVYVFTVKIVDPNFSFCELTAEFAVETYGVTIREDGTIIVSLVWSFIFILLCSFAYSYYKYMKIFGEMLYYKQIKYAR
ncbi:cation channel sperm-associated auxiliary subunit epsilon [Rhincodon typus]|uniref:cation channel sperm-associated auxiliary subunit epsilon n=1 Tax=Rhincodon typus TaxID=259920 RepID=UPI00202DCEEB|nr:cation channel sperm-associated auxiliary subunit epsilon [Rhincodon typus]